jgi:hypothetical protein
MKKDRQRGIQRRYRPYSGVGSLELFAFIFFVIAVMKLEQ